MGPFRDIIISYTVSLTSEERTETEDLNHTFTVPTNNIAEYRPTLQANTPCTREVMCSVEPICEWFTCTCTADVATM